MFLKPYQDKRLIKSKELKYHAKETSFTGVGIQKY